MMIRYGQIRRGGIIYEVYESDTPVLAQAALAALSKNAFEAAFSDTLGTGTTLVHDTPNATRLDKQNPNGSVSFPGFAGGRPIYDNLSLQTGSQSVGVLYVQTDFVAGYGIGTDTAGYRGIFTSLVNNNTLSSAQGLLLRIFYTWLAMSNARNRKFVISSSRVEAAPAALNAADAYKTRAQAFITW